MYFFSFGRSSDYSVVRSFTAPVLLQAGTTDRIFHFQVPTVAVKSYIIEYKNSLFVTNWWAFSPFTGDGMIKLLAYPGTRSANFLPAAG